MKTNYLMKQLILFLLTSALVSCQKEVSFETATDPGGTGGGSNGYFIRAKLNGKDHNFNYNEMAAIIDLGGGTKTLSLIGSASPNSTDLESLNLTITSFNGSLTTGTYSENAQTVDYIAAGLYNPNSASILYTAGLTTSTALPLTITINKIDSAVVEGTFSGAFYKTDVSSGGPSSEYLSFTDGAFRLAVK